MLFFFLPSFCLSAETNWEKKIRRGFSSVYDKRTLRAIALWSASVLWTSKVRVGYIVFQRSGRREEQSKCSESKVHGKNEHGLKILAPIWLRWYRFSLTLIGSGFYKRLLNVRSNKGNTIYTLLHITPHSQSSFYDMKWLLQSTLSSCKRSTPRVATKRTGIISQIIGRHSHCFTS